MQRRAARTTLGRAHDVTRGSILRIALGPRKTTAQRLRVPFFLIGTCSTWAHVVGSRRPTPPPSRSRPLGRLAPAPPPRPPEGRRGGWPHVGGSASRPSSSASPGGASGAGSTSSAARRRPRAASVRARAPAVASAAGSSSLAVSTRSRRRRASRAPRRRPWSARPARRRAVDIGGCPVGLRRRPTPACRHGRGPSRRRLAGWAPRAWPGTRCRCRCRRRRGRRGHRARVGRPRTAASSARLGSTGASWTSSPRPLQCSQVSENASSRPVPIRLRVICTRPSEVTSATWWRVRSRPRHSTRRRSTRSRLDSRTMSMKSTTMMPPMSRSRSWRTISSAASRLFLVTVSSRLPPEPVNLPVLTSTTVIASVRSMISEPPEGSQTLRSRPLWICSSMRSDAKRSTSWCSAAS